MATFIGGIASSQAIDSSGEAIDINGLDISSLVGSVINWEHKSDQPSSYIGKILKAKKIFSVEDCSNEVEKRFWDKCQIPFLFCLARLNDDYQASAKEVAGIFAADAADPSLPPTLGFSIEGAKLNKEGHVITHSIARKLTLTAQPCNKTCLADTIDINEKPSSDPLSFLFKSQEIELFSEETLQKSESMPMPKTPKPAKPGLKQAPENEGMSIGTTQSGQHVMSHAKVHNYSGFSAQDHRDASVLHNNAATKANAAKNSKLADHHNQKMKLHNQAAAGLERKANRFGNAVKAKGQKEENKKILGKGEEMDKALTAGGFGMQTPGELNGGAALQSMDGGKKKKKSVSTTMVVGGGMAKSDQWLIRANEEYKTWGKKEEFRSFMKEKLPHLTKAEIDSFGKTMLLKKTVEAEKALGKLIKK